MYFVLSFCCEAPCDVWMKGSIQIMLLLLLLLRLVTLNSLFSYFGNAVVLNPFPVFSAFQIMVYMTGGTKVVDSDFNRRLSFLYPMPFSNVSIAINNTKEADSGQYMCTVNLLNSGSEQNIGLINLTVLVPACGLFIGISLAPVRTRCWTRWATSLVQQGPSLCSYRISLPPLITVFCFLSAVTPFAAINGAMVAGAVIGALIGLGLIILFPLQMLFYRRKMKESQEEIANEIKEDAVAPKTLSWAKSPGSDIVSKNGTLSSMNTTRDHKLYPSKPPSDTASITTATGSTVGYKPPFSNHRGGTHTPTPSLSSQSLPLYFPPMANGVHCHHANVPIHRNTLHRTNGAQPQAPRLHEPAAPTQGLTSSTLSRMGGVPVMVPAQSQAGSLV
uniref:Endothelial cell adhesion molecule n=1 Tax=Podarcis muralis TaxID=64176 RepID=A0A670JQ49_PODMU